MQEERELTIKALESDHVSDNAEFNMQSFYEQILTKCEILTTHKLKEHLCQVLVSKSRKKLKGRTIFHVYIDEQRNNIVDRIEIYKSK